MRDDLTPAQLRRELSYVRDQLGLMTIGMGQARHLINDLTEQRDEARRELARLRSAAGAYLATTEGRAVTFREGLTRAELAAAVEGKP